MVYCKSGNFSATLIFVLFALFWARAKLKARKCLFCVKVFEDGWKSEFLTQAKMSKIAEAQKITRAKLPCVQ